LPMEPEKRGGFDCGGKRRPTVIRKKVWGGMGLSLTLRFRTKKGRPRESFPRYCVREKEGAGPRWGEEGKKRRKFCREKKKKKEVASP